MGLDDKLRSKMQVLLKDSSDASLTASELRRKYDDEDVNPRTPSSPRLRSCSSTSDASLLNRHSFASHARVPAATRCWACSTALRDPGAAFFSCGACGALNGEEPPVQLPRRGLLCAVLSRRGRMTLFLTIFTFVWVCVQGASVLLPRMATGGDDAAGGDGSSASSPRPPLRHTLAFAFLLFGLGFNLLATTCVGPGTVDGECCPLRIGGSGGGSSTGSAAAGGGGASGESKRAMSPLALEAGGAEGGGSAGAANNPRLELARLCGERGEMPLRGWRRCTETGLSMPPRSHYCNTCKRGVLRMEVRTAPIAQSIDRPDRTEHRPPRARTPHAARRPQWDGLSGRRAASPSSSFQPDARSRIRLPLSLCLGPLAASAPAVLSQHHCVLLNTCIGHRNLHYFVGALGYALAAAAYVALAAGCALRREILPSLLAAAAAAATPPEQVMANAATGLSGLAAQLAAAAAAAAAEAQAATPTTSAAPFPWTSAAVRAACATPASRTLLALTLLGIGTFCGVLPTLVMQIVQLRKGATFVESCKAPRANEFDLGGSANCSAVFGSGACRCLLHLLPLPRAAAGDGLSFASRPPARRV